LLFELGLEFGILLVCRSRSNLNAFSRYSAIIFIVAASLVVTELSVHPATMSIAARWLATHARRLRTVTGFQPADASKALPRMSVYRGPNEET
jgi:hypothetical protein